MGLLNMFNKKKDETPAYDINNMKITDLQLGFLLDYDLKTWEVKEVYEYDWGNDFFSYEYQLDSGEEIIYLSIEHDDELELEVCKKINVRAIDENLPEYIAQNQFPPPKVVYKGITFFRDSENPGYFRNVDTMKPDESEEFISWDYYDEDDKQTLCVEQWDDRVFEAAFGKVVKEYEFSNIMPGKHK